MIHTKKISNARKRCYLRTSSPSKYELGLEEDDALSTPNEREIKDFNKVKGKRWNMKKNDVIWGCYV